MTGITERTIDWEQYWQASPDPRDDAANGSTEHVLEPLLEFLDARDAPDSYADVGCGGGALAEAVASEYPDATVVGYDAAAPVVEANRRRTGSADGGDGPNGAGGRPDGGRSADAAGGDRDAPEVRYERAALPDFDPDRQFDLVTAFFTLCYVPDAALALQALYDAVAPGGHLVFTYHNTYAQSVFQRIAADPHRHLDEDAAWDPDTFADRFELVLDGENLLSYEAVHDGLGAWPQSVWAEVEEADPYPAWRQNPLVYVPK